MRLTLRSVWVLATVAVGCANPPLPTVPSSLPVATSQEIVLEAGAGTGDGDLHHRSHASSTMTIHLAPGQRRVWTFTASSASRYSIFVTYSNDNPGDSEVLRVEVDGNIIGTFRAQDTGDDGGLGDLRRGSGRVIDAR